MKTLYLLRHAKSSWDSPADTDFERPLNKRGKRTAPLMGQFLAERDLVPDAIVCSTAARAKRTAELIAENCGFEGEIQFTGELYPTSIGRCVNALQTVPDAADSAMIVAHNPGIEEFLRHLSGEYQTVQTCVLSHLEVDLDAWSEFSYETTGKLLGVFRPRELFDEAD